MDIDKVRRCFSGERVLPTGHARREMETEGYGRIRDIEVAEAIASGGIIQQYPEDRPYSSAQVYGTTQAGRPLHAVCAHDAEDDRVVVVTVYQPDPALWVDFRRRKRP